MIRFSKKRVAKSLLIFGTLLLVISGSLAYTRLYMTPERRFWSAIENGLRTESVVKEVVTKNPNGTTITDSRLSFAPLVYSETKTATHQRIDTQTSSDVVTRTLTTPKDAFVRYDSINSNEKKPNGSKYDFSSIEGLWAKRDSSDYTETDLLERLSASYIQTVPFANLDLKESNQFIDKLKASGAYEVDFSQTAEDHDNDLTVYTVNLKAKAYVAVLQDMFKQLGLGESTNLDASQYDETSSIKLHIAINGANQVRKVAYPQSGKNDSNFETYRDYGARVPVNPDTQHAVSFSDLQTRMNSIQQ